MITFDFETRSHADLRAVGPWAYSEHPTTEVICACWQIEDEEVQEWWLKGAGGVPERRGSLIIDFYDSTAMPADLYRAIHTFDKFIGVKGNLGK